MASLDVDAMEKEKLFCEVRGILKYGYSLRYHKTKIPQGLLPGYTVLTEAVHLPFILNFIVYLVVV